MSTTKGPKLDPVEQARAAAERGVEHLRELRARQAAELAEHDQRLAAHAAELAAAEREFAAAEAECSRAERLTSAREARIDAGLRHENAQRAADDLMTHLIAEADALTEAFRTAVHAEDARVATAEQLVHAAEQLGRLGENTSTPPVEQHRLTLFRDITSPLTHIASAARTRFRDDPAVRRVRVAPLTFS